jgi:putative ABC transport system permease protein
VAIPVELFVCHYQKPEQGVLSVAVTSDKDWTTAFTFAIAPQDLDAFAKSRTAALVLEATAKKYGWKIGDRLPLICRAVQKNGSPNWTFEVVGTFTDSDFGGGGDKIIMSFPYYDEARASGKGTVNHINVSVTDPNLAVPVADAIDRLSANSSHETKTESIRELAQQQVQQVGDFDFLIRAVVSAVLAALLFAIATMMVQSVHERTSELAVLKTIGFTDRAVFMLILAEALSVCILAGAFGLALATAALPIAARVVTGLSMPKITLAIGLGFAVLVALISAAVPALLAARLRVSTALAER